MFIWAHIKSYSLMQLFSIMKPILVSLCLAYVLFFNSFQAQRIERKKKKKERSVIYQFLKSLQIVIRQKRLLITHSVVDTLHSNLYQCHRPKVMPASWSNTLIHPAMCFFLPIAIFHSQPGINDMFRVTVNWKQWMWRNFPKTQRHSIIEQNKSNWTTCTSCPQV